MRTGRPIPPLRITATERESLEAYARGHDRRLASRAAAILASADGISNKDVAVRFGMTKQTVGKWRARFRTRRVAGLQDDPRPGAPRRITDDQVAEVIRLASQPGPIGVPWTTRSMAHAVGLTQTAVSRIWRMHGIKPAGAHRGAHREQDRDQPLATPAPPPPSRTTREADDDSPARARTLAAIHALLRDARALRGTGSADLDPLLALAIDAIERALERTREPVKSSYARADTALRNARQLLDLAAVAARNVERSLADREAAASAAVAAMRTVAEGLRTAAEPPPRCPSCGTSYTLRFMARATGGNVVTARLRCPRPRCGKTIQVQVPETAEQVRLEEAAAS